jgi:vacuolar-type H+-ATPase subunit I/STV1
MDCPTKQQLMDRLADVLSRLRDRLLAEKEATQNLDRKRMDELEAEIAQILDEKTRVLAAVRQYMEDHGN